MAQTRHAPLAARRAPLAVQFALVRQLPPDRAALALVALVTFLASLSLATLPGFLSRMSDNGLKRGIGETQPFERNIALTQVSALPLRPNGTALTQVSGVADIDAAGANLQAAMPAPVRALVDRRTVVADGPRMIVRPLPGAAPVLFSRFFQLRYQSGIADRVRLVAGHLPVVREPTTPAELTGDPGAGTDKLPLVETAITEATAREMELALGDRIIVVSDPSYWRETTLLRRPQAYQVIVEVAGIIEASAPDDEYWFSDPRLLRPGVVETPDVTLVYGTGLLATDAYPAVQQLTNPEPWTYQWRYFIEPGRITQATLGELLTGLQKVGYLYPSTTRVTTALPELIRRITGQRQLAVTILALAVVGLAAVGLAVLGSLATLLAARRRRPLVLARDRGASTGQLAMAQCAEGLFVSLPAAALGGALAAFLLPATSPVLPAAASGAVAVATTIMLVAALLLALRQARAGALRPPVGRRMVPGRRLVFEVLVVAVALAGLGLLRRRGLAALEGTFDPYLLAVPVLLSLATGLVIIRALPLVARIGDGAAARGRGLVAHLGIRRLAQPMGAQLPLLAIVLAATLTTFTATIRHSIGVAQDETIWERVGADFRIDSAGADLLSPPALDLSGIVGITAVARGSTASAVQLAPASVRTSGVTLLTLDLASYQAVVAGTPADPHLPDALLNAPVLDTSGQRQSPIPAIISSRWVLVGAPRVGMAFGLTIGEAEVNFIVVAIRDRFPGVSPDQPFVIAPLAAVRAATPGRPLPITTVLIRAGENTQGALDRAASQQVPPATLTSRRTEYEAARDAPFVTGVTTGFRWSLILMAFLALLAVAATTEQSARAVAHERAHLRLLGLHARQVRALTALELLPPVVLSGLAGGALGVALTRLIGTTLDLTVFTGPGSIATLQTDWATVAILAAILLGTALVAATVAGTAAARATLGQFLRESFR